ncbi:cobalamin biosynthesis protein, partial [Streptomyces rochei]|uniref:cobalamin biosynthesis protein n=1 Tax=Streptomyces rochei TaxID=1928 RepID=UPI003F4D46A6
MGQRYGPPPTSVAVPGPNLRPSLGRRARAPRTAGAVRRGGGRDPQALDADGIARAVVESVAENTSDAVVG